MLQAVYASKYFVRGHCLLSCGENGKYQTNICRSRRPQPISLEIPLSNGRFILVVKDNKDVLEPNRF